MGKVKELLQEIKETIDDTDYDYEVLTNNK